MKKLILLVAGILLVALLLTPAVYEYGQAESAKKDVEYWKAQAVSARVEGAACQEAVKNADVVIDDIVMTFKGGTTTANAAHAHAYFDSRATMTCRAR